MMALRGHMSSELAGIKTKFNSKMIIRCVNDPAKEAGSFLRSRIEN